MKKITLLALVLSVTFLAAPSSFASRGSDRSQKAVISHFTGRVEVKLPGETEWKKPDYSTVLTEGAIVRTQKGARAVITIKDPEDLISLDMNDISELKFLTFDREPATGNKTTLLDLSAGEITVNSISADKSKNKFEIKTPTSMIDVLGGETSLKVTVTHDAD